jgi:4-amino-4-deoxy-L-arabinose transferase-like glycosyltransferase
MSAKQHAARWREVIFVVLLFLVALILRVYALDRFPPGLYNDEAAYGMDGLEVMNGNYAIFFERNNGREPLFIYLLSVAFRVFGATPYAIRLTSALIGAVTVVTAYWMVREMSGFRKFENRIVGRWHAIWVGLFMAFSYWHISFSRLGFRAIMLPLVMTIAFAFFWRVWREERDTGRRPWVETILCGFFLGLCSYTYTAGRLALLLFVVIAAVTLWQSKALKMERGKTLRTSGVIIVTALIVFAPLGLYFIQHPESFGQRAASVSLFSQEFAGDDPAAALVNSTVKTTLMFLSEPDPNRRHNPGKRPVFDPLLGLWFFGGVVLALIQWRKLPQLVHLLWAALFILPAVLTAEGTPHSLRAIGVLPAALVLATGAMLWVGQQLSMRRSRLAFWLPLPFFIFSSLLSVSDYFGAWGDLSRFRAPFLTDYVVASRAIAERGGDDLWILMLSPNYPLADDKFNTMDFIVRDQARHATVLMNEKVAPQRLSELLQGGDVVNVLQPSFAPDLAESSFVFLDAKELMDFLLRRTGRFIEERDGADIGGIPYMVYQVSDAPNFSLPPEDIPARIAFDDIVHLEAFSLGGAGVDFDQSSFTIAGDQPLWVVLRWQADAPIDIDLKTSLLLLDSQGNVVGQQDDLLTGDDYPFERTWEAGQPASTYHILTPFAGIPPGEYTLHLRVYEDESGRIYPAQTPDGARDLSAPLAIIQATPAVTTPVVAPTVVLTDALLGPELALLGYDLPRNEVAPGDRLPLTLYWRAAITPTMNYSAHVALLDSRGETVAATQASPGGATFPTNGWRQSETVRMPAFLPVDAATTSGIYTLTAGLAAEGKLLDQLLLTRVTVAGRPRLFQPPAELQPAAATFGDLVRLVGVNAPEVISASPGEEVSFDLVWQPLSVTDLSLVRFVQALDSAGRLVAQQDGTPCAGACPSTSWLVGEYLVDGARLALPPDLPPGEYRLIAGWYDQATQQRLAGMDEAGEPLGENVAEAPIILSLNTP